MPKFAIYTAVVGNYDEIHQPLAVDPRFDYFLFSDTITEDRIGVWQIRPINYYNPDQVKIARYVKTHPETLLPDYDATLWMDANIQIVDSWIYERFVELYSQGCQIASVKHPERDCVYDEIITICACRWETLEGAWKWNQYLRHHKYPQHNGLLETNIVFRKKLQNIKILDEEWWLFIEKYSRRDQFSLNFVLWKHKEKSDYILSNGECVANSVHFNYIIHSSISESVKNKQNGRSINRLYSYFYPKGEINLFFSICYHLIYLPFPLFAFTIFCWSQYVRLKNDIIYYLNIR